MNDQWSDIQRWASTGGGEGDEVQDTESIRAYIEAEIGNLGQLVFDTGEIPGSASSRSRGAFSDYNDLYRYLDSGGLIVRDSSGAEVPNNIVWIFAREYDDGLVIYEVYIDDETE